MGSRDELHGSSESAAGRLARQPRYTAQFRQAFPDTEAGAPLVSPVRIQKALAAYERSLVRLKAFLVTLTDTARRP